MAIERQSLGNPQGLSDQVNNINQDELDNLTMLLENEDGSVDVSLTEEDIDDSFDEEDNEFYKNLVDDLV